MQTAETEAAIRWYEQAVSGRLVEAAGHRALIQRPDRRQRDRKRVESRLPAGLEAAIRGVLGTDQYGSGVPLGSHDSLDFLLEDAPQADPSMPGGSQGRKAPPYRKGVNLVFDRMVSLDPRIAKGRSLNKQLETVRAVLNKVKSRPDAVAALARPALMPSRTAAPAMTTTAKVAAAFSSTAGVASNTRSTIATSIARTVGQNGRELKRTERALRSRDSTTDSVLPLSGITDTKRKDLSLSSLILPGRSDVAALVAAVRPRQTSMSIISSHAPDKFLENAGSDARSTGNLLPPIKLDAFSRKESPYNQLSSNRSSIVPHRSINDGRPLAKDHRVAVSQNVSGIDIERRRQQATTQPYDAHAGESRTGTPASGITVALRGSVNVDGRRIGNIVAAGQTSAASLPTVSSASVNLRALPIFRGTSVVL